MVKARKRGKKIKAVDSETKKVRTKGAKVIFIIVLVLIFSGFTLTAFINPPIQTGNGETQTPIRQLYGLGQFIEVKEGGVLNLTGYHAVYGDPNKALGFKNLLRGDLIYLDEFITALILTNATRGEISEVIEGENYIIYRIASCEGFDCLVENESMVNESILFNVYLVNSTSGFLTSDMVGVPIPELEAPSEETTPLI
jgi:hypothetical protein